MVERLTCPSQEHYTSLQFTYYLQYHLHKQLLDASRHAARQHVALKGDLPIGAPDLAWLMICEEFLHLAASVDCLDRPAPGRQLQAPSRSDDQVLLRPGRANPCLQPRHLLMGPVLRQMACLNTPVLAAIWSQQPITH